MSLSGLRREMLANAPAVSGYDASGTPLTVYFMEEIGRQDGRAIAGMIFDAVATSVEGGNDDAIGDRGFAIIEGKIQKMRRLGAWVPMLAAYRTSALKQISDELQGKIGAIHNA